jgi:NADH-quinone oxidoreductase subunit C
VVAGPGRWWLGRDGGGWAGTVAAMNDRGANVDVLQKVADALRQRFAGVTFSVFRQDTRVRVPRACLYEALQFLQQECGFDMLVDITCVDYLHYRAAADRFGLVYQLCSTVHNLRLTIRVMLNEPDLVIPSVTPLWEAANWLEREVFDMFGIHFENHPDLRRILLPPEFTSYPLRKDYPLQGRGERHHFTALTREGG